jgi:3-vinyl bacteriochlorophyllide hydratase
MRQPRPTGSTTPLYTPAERARRDASPWTPVQGFLAALQFVIFIVSCVLVWRYLITGAGAAAATASVIAKTFALYAIMITGSLWERDVFGQYLFAPVFFWEDVVSMIVIALHTAYLVAWLFDLLPLRELFVLALLAYSFYVLNASQFLVKFRRARQTVPASDTKLREVRA